MTNQQSPSSSTIADLGRLFEDVTGRTSITERQQTEDRRLNKAATADDIELSVYIGKASKADGLADAI